MRNTLIAVGILLLTVLLILGACGKASERISGEFTRTFHVPMTGIQIECFDFDEGEKIEGKFTVDGQYTVDLSVIYAEMVPKGGKAYSLSNRVLKKEKTLETDFSFVAPVSSEYAFCFGGLYADKVESGKPYEGLRESVTLYITVYARS